MATQVQIVETKLIGTCLYLVFKAFKAFKEMMGHRAHRVTTVIRVRKVTMAHKVLRVIKDRPINTQPTVLPIQIFQQFFHSQMTLVLVVDLLIQQDKELLLQLMGLTTQLQL